MSAATPLAAAMKAPAGLAGAVLLLWGLAIGLPWLGAAAGLGLEALRRAVPAPAAAAWLAPVVRACALLALASLAWLLVTQGPPQALYSWLRWLPLMLLPLPALQLRIGRVTVSGLLKSPRKRALPAQAARPGADHDDDEVDLTHVHAAITLVAAGTGDGAQGWLYPGFVLIVGWALLARQAQGPRRSKHPHDPQPPPPSSSRRALAAAMLLLASGIGYLTHVGIVALQGQVEKWSTELIADRLAEPPNAFRERTRIGDLGKVKLSDRIVMRVVAEEPLRPQSLLLREAVFDRYRGGEWQSVRRAARPAARVDGEPGDKARDGAGNGDATHWGLVDDASHAATDPGAGRGAGSRLSVRRSLPGGEGLLPLPLGARRIDALPARWVDVLATGTVRAHGTPRFIAMEVVYDEAAELGAPEPALDLEVPAVLAGTLARVLDDERLRQASPAATVAAVQAFFASKFAYSLALGDAGPAAGGPGARTLPDFLLRDRKGHCEYFATATVLLLRQAGIPARYVGGFSVQEYSAREQAFVVRARHAHAWAQAWVNGRWVFVDTTPSRWAAAEEEAVRSDFGPLLDLLSWLVERAVQAWLTISRRDLAMLAAALFGVLLVAVLAVPAWQLVARRLRRHRHRSDANQADAVASAWARVEASLARAGHARAPGETVRDWVRRLDSAGRPATDSRPGQVTLRELGEAYYRVRFDPAASAEQLRAFVDLACGWNLPRPSSKP